MGIFKWIAAVSKGASLGNEFEDIKRRAAIERIAQLDAERVLSQAAAKAAEAQRQREELQLSVNAVCRLSSEAQSAALFLPTLLAETETDLDRAETEMEEVCYSPFWEAVEDATAKLNSFDQWLVLIEDRKTRYTSQNRQLGDLAPVFSLGMAILPDPARTQGRLTALYRRAQKSPDFANIYEQRRIAAKLDKTNAILVAGFNSLGQAIERLGDRTVDALQGLGRDLDFRLGSIESSLECAAAAAAEQRSALIAELERSNQKSDNVLQQLRQDADNRSEHERAARSMLDNIQRRRKLTITDPSY